MFLFFFFFFQAEDGIRDDLVTGVQTCALPICACLEGARQVRYLVPALFCRAYPDVQVSFRDKHRLFLQGEYRPRDDVGDEGRHAGRHEKADKGYRSDGLYVPVLKLDELLLRHADEYRADYLRLIIYDRIECRDVFLPRYHRLSPVRQRRVYAFEDVFWKEVADCPRAPLVEDVGGDLHVSHGDRDERAGDGLCQRIRDELVVVYEVAGDERAKDSPGRVHHGRDHDEHHAVPYLTHVCAADVHIYRGERLYPLGLK